MGSGVHVDEQGGNGILGWRGVINAIFECSSLVELCAGYEIEYQLVRCSMFDAQCSMFLIRGSSGTVSKVYIIPAPILNLKPC